MSRLVVATAFPFDLLSLLYTGSVSLVWCVFRNTGAGRLRRTWLVPASSSRSTTRPVQSLSFPTDARILLLGCADDYGRYTEVAGSVPRDRLLPRGRIHYVKKTRKPGLRLADFRILSIVARCNDNQRYHFHADPALNRISLGVGSRRSRGFFPEPRPRIVFIVSGRLAVAATRCATWRGARLPEYIIWI